MQIIILMRELKGFKRRKNCHFVDGGKMRESRFVKKSISSMMDRSAEQMSRKQECISGSGIKEKN